MENQEIDRTKHELWQQFVDENYFRSVAKWYELTWEQFLQLKGENKDHDYKEED